MPHPQMQKRAQLVRGIGRIRWRSPEGAQAVRNAHVRSILGTGQPDFFREALAMIDVARGKCFNIRLPALLRPPDRNSCINETQRESHDEGLSTAELADRPTRRYSCFHGLDRSSCECRCC